MSWRYMPARQTLAAGIEGAASPVDAWRHSLLATHLQATVPLRMAELSEIDHDTLADHAERCGLMVTEHGDVIQYLGRETRPAVGALVDGLACAALISDGGITYDGMHWCVDHGRCKAVRHEC